MEAAPGGGEKKEKGEKGEDGKRIRGKHKIWLVRHGEDRRHRVDSEYDVGQLDHHQSRQQRGGGATRIDLGDELVPVVGRGYRNEPLHERHGPLRTGALLGPMPVDLESGVDQEDTEEHHDPLEPADDGSAATDEEGAQDQCPEDAPEQDPVLELERDAHRGEHDRPDEHVVEAQGTLDQVTGGVLAKGPGPELPGDVSAEEEPDHDPDDGFGQGLTAGYVVIVTVPVQICGDQDHDDHQEEEPGEKRIVDRDEVLAGALEEVHGRDACYEG